VNWVQVEVKAIMTNQLLLRAGQLPDWLRQMKGLYALDTFDDNLCLFSLHSSPPGDTPRSLHRKKLSS